MDFEIIRIEDFLNSKATIYTIIEKGAENSLFQQFLNKYYPLFPDEVGFMMQRLISIGRKVGAQDHFFKHGEGLLGDGVSALYDQPNYKLRLFCVRYGSGIVILGGGGIKKTKTWQEDPILKKQAELMIEFSKKLTNRIKSGEIKWAEDQKSFLGNMIFNDDEQD